MRTPNINIFKKHEKEKSETGKSGSDHSHRSASIVLVKAMPSWWVVLLAYVLAVVFCYLVHRFFLWFPPYLLEVFANLRGLPTTWAELGLYWGEKGLIWIAIASAVYHNLWQVGTRYKLTSHDVQLQNWFPVRRVTVVPYGAVRRVGFQQSLFGYLLNYGHVEVDTGSPAGPLVLLNCPRPQKFLDVLQPKVEAVIQPSLTHHKRATDS